MPNLYMCSFQMSSKYVWGIGLIDSSLENRHVGLREEAEKGINVVYFTKTHVLGHMT